MMEQCLVTTLSSSSSTIEKVLLFSESYPSQGVALPQSYSDMLVEQNRLKDTIFQWLLSSLLLLQDKDGNNELEVHILNWETL
jgi:hypothetical protein